MNKANIIFLDGIEAPNSSYSTFLGYLFPLASVLENAGYTFKILSVRNLIDYSLQGIIQELKKYQFDTIGISTNSDNIRFAYKICDEIKSFFPRVKIILGGPHVTYTDKKTLKECRCDIIVRGEGEMKLLEIIKNISNGKSYEHVKGISYKNEDTIIRNDNSTPIDINQLPTPQYAILSDIKYWIIPTGINEKQFTDILLNIKKSYTFFMTGRGCPYKCAFCVEGNIKSKYQFRNAENVKKDLVYFLQKTGHTFISIGDDTFTSSPKRVIELCDIFIEIQKEYPFVWFCEGRVDIISKYPEMIAIMYNAGLKKLQIGIESGNQKTLDIYNKGITLKQMEAVVKEAVKYKDLIMAGNIILGNPHESLSEFKKGLEFIKHLILLSNFKLDIATSYLAPFHGTPIRENPEKFGINIISDFEFRRVCMLDIVSKPNTLSKEEINSLKILVEKELSEFINEHVFKLPKDYILSFYKKRSLLSQMPSALYKSWWRLASFKKYLQVWNKALVANAKFITLDSCDNYSPLRLWNIEYDCEKKEYYFIELSGQKYIIGGENVFLWKQATGKKSVYEIFEEANMKYSNVKLSAIELTFTKN
jgi:radical SAM superfamily enzyme YgiQ (UPF0313 family)